MQFFKLAFTTTKTIKVTIIIVYPCHWFLFFQIYRVRLLVFECPYPFPGTQIYCEDIEESLEERKEVKINKPKEEMKLRS